ncbi:MULTISPECIES: IS5 family transposase [unclassified Chitinophaga]|uniref:IS5 family transposase n=1 Tax=unclassified Chitinophaga TaxID=2619133 RepID=UPI001C6FCA79|nr:MULTISPECIES: IS5 family transposase [unclassified Chitinophaga]WPV63877.1 IS5 family transposase [Chitinophaga sp. LS1]
MSRRENLTDDQWALIKPLIPIVPVREHGKGRPRIHSDREVLNGILWVLRTGASWIDLPGRFPSGSTCFRRFSSWSKSGVFRKILETLAQDLETRGGIDLSECFIDGTFAVAKKGAQEFGKTKRGKGTKLMVITDANGLPLAVHTTSASPHEVTLVEATINETFTVGQPTRIIGDRAYDSDPLDDKLALKGVELIAPHKNNRVKPATQDGRQLRRYKRKWKIERFFAWLNKFKRVITRYDRSIKHYESFVHLAFIKIILRRYL